MEWLQRSIVGEIVKTINFSLLTHRILQEWICVPNIREIGAYKAFVTFDSKESMQEALSSIKELLLNHFEEVRPWSEEEWCQTRTIWVECYGIPPYAQTIKNIKIRQVWGTVVCLDKVTKERKSFSVARILINTYVLQSIDRWIYLSIGRKGFDIFLKKSYQRCL